MSFTKEVSDAPLIPGEGKPRRQVDYANALTGSPEDAATLYEVFQRGLSISGTSPFMGTRQVNDGVAGEYNWISYQEANTRISNLGSALVKRAGGLDQKSMIGLFSINRQEWVLAEHASFRQNFITVPLYDTLGDEVIEYIINQTEMKIVFATKDKAKSLLKIAAKVPTLKEIVIMDSTDSDLVALGKSNNILVIGITELESVGSAAPVNPSPPIPDDIATICYTSGTTGMPKGVILSHANIMAFSGGITALQKVKKMYEFSKNDVHISYLPLAHVFERVIQVHLMYVGASFGFYQGDTLKLLDDVSVLKPTLFASVPRLYNRIYDKVLAGVKAKGGLAAILFHKALEAKKAGLEKGHLTHWLWDRLVFGKVRERLGGRVKVMLTGAAPISGEVLTFLRCAFSVNIMEGYGQTESAAAVSVSGWHDLSSGQIGSPMTCTEVKLVDVPSMNYTSADQPLPRGEICFRGNNVFKGYYKLDDKTAETIDKDGWVHTGDIGLWDAEGRLKIIDRVKNIFKLAQGEYIAPEKIENVYARHELLAQIFVYGESLQSTLVAVVIPDPDSFVPWAKQQSFGDANKTLADYCSNEACQAAVLKEISAFVKGELKGFECVKNIHLHPEMFSVDNGLLTPTFKLKRHEAKKLFQKKIDAMYAKINSTQ